LISAHPDKPDEPVTTVDTSAIAPAIQALACPFISADLVQSGDHCWRVVEIGDGQVSDRPSSVHPRDFFHALFDD
jgi:hypothetical protein